MITVPKRSNTLAKESNLNNQNFINLPPFQLSNKLLGPETGPEEDSSPSRPTRTGHKFVKVNQRYS